MVQKNKQPKRRPVQLPSDLWRLLWKEAKKQSEPTSPAQIAREILYRHFGKP